MNVLWIILIFIIVVFAIGWFFTKSKTLSNYSLASATTTYPAIKLSNPASTNYSYSIWIYVSSWTITDSPKYIFTRCNDNGCFPEVSLSPVENTLNVRISSNDSSGDDTLCQVPNIPLQAWTNLVISLNTKVLDIYVNGKLVKTCITTSIPSFNKDADVVLTPAPSFTGYTSRFVYYPNATGPEQAWSTYRAGPGGNLLMSFLNQYQIKLSFLNGTTEAASITI